MKHLIIEGVWEEVVQRADEFRGKRVRLVVLEEPARVSTCVASVANPLDAIVGMTSSGERNLSEQHDEVLYQQR
ncbi:MAG: hypothetical protein RMM08_10690 [Armatimonadota bacterium]|nr:hypothetical protein [bacterium]MDW8321820.1 hypothetical protein [Armatimonadota bacterium]